MSTMTLPTNTRNIHMSNQNNAFTVSQLTDEEMDTTGAG